MIHISDCLKKNIKELSELRKEYKEPEQKEIVKATPEMFDKIKAEINKVGREIK